MQWTAGEGHMPGTNQQDVSSVTRCPETRDCYTLETELENYTTLRYTLETLQPTLCYTI